MTAESDLSDRLAAILDSGPRPVTADRAIELAQRQLRATANEHPQGYRPPRRTAWAWLAFVVVLIAGLVLGVNKFSNSTTPEGHGRLAPVSQPTVSAVRSPTVPPGVHNKVKAPEQSWPEQVIADVGSAEDVAPTAQALYWLSLPGSPSNGVRETVAPRRYDESTHQVTSGPSITGYGIGDPAITVTGGWVWVVLGGTKSVEVVQYDPRTMDIHKEQTFPIAQLPTATVDTPILSATVNGPLWIAAVDDLWALNPSTGTIETELDSGYPISSMSTDPTGTRLYVGGNGNSLTLPGEVTEYDAETGHWLGLDTFGDVGPPTVAAATGAVWVASQGGTMGGVVELSSHDLSTIGPSDQGGFSTTYDQQMGFSVGVSDGVLWLGNVLNGFQCADPGTGAIRSTEFMPAEFITDPYARDGVVYAIEGPRLVAITPPAACFQ